MAIIVKTGDSEKPPKIDYFGSTRVTYSATYTHVE
jgi:hypothetical protein